MVSVLSEGAISSLHYVLQPIVFHDREILLHHPFMCG